MPFTAPTAASAAAPAAVADAENGAEVTAASTAAVPAAAALLCQTRRSVGRLSSGSLKSPSPPHNNTDTRFLGDSALTFQVIYLSVPGLAVVLKLFSLIKRTVVWYCTYYLIHFFVGSAYTLKYNTVTKLFRQLKKIFLLTYKQRRLLVDSSVTVFNQKVKIE